MLRRMTSAAVRPRREYSLVLVRTQSRKPRSGSVQPEPLRFPGDAVTPRAVLSRRLRSVSPPPHPHREASAQ
ncbi:hypothetical protein FQA47_011952 [Oryzias melastigma]|uniref:Uncharacterized protein n=1 Tax=Oryzias melastigma TaxID=30732 RepID=A0A834CDB2_ORYME|nr:hypothetical protein FQA47_011952 [Oryzias melastigma]